MIWVTVVILLILGVAPCFVLGYLIGVKKRVELISGYDPKKVADPNGLAVWTGKLCNRIGVLIVGLTIGISGWPEHGRGISISLSFVIMVVCLIYFLGSRQYYKQPDQKDLPF